MLAAQLHKNVMRLINLGAQAIDNPFISTDEIHKEIIGLMNEKVLEYATSEKLSNLVQICDFRVYKPWVANDTVVAGDVRTGTYNGEKVRYLCIRGGLSESEPSGALGVEFTMNNNTVPTISTTVQASVQYRIGKNLWQPAVTGQCGTTFPDENGIFETGDIFVDETGFTWNFIRPVLFWKNMGDPNLYPLNEICPNYKIFDNASFVSITRNRRLQCLTPQQWNQKRAMNVISDSIYFMSTGDSFGNNCIALYPNFAVNEKVSFLYQQKNFIRASDGVTLKEQFTADDDELLFPYDVFIEGVAGIFLQDKGLSTAARHLDTEKRMLNKYLQQNNIAPVINMTGTIGMQTNIKEGTWVIQ